MLTERRTPTRAEIESYLRQQSNWGRWGALGGSGAVNLITPEKRLEAARLVRNGRTVSLARPWPVQANAENPKPAQLITYLVDELDGDWRSAHDYIGMSFHGIASTHIDALCHMWGPDGMWDGRDPSRDITSAGAKYGAVDAWSGGIVTRGVLLDIPRHRKKPYVTYDEPVHGWELADIARAQGVQVGPGDALLVYSGREAYAADHGGTWGGHPTWPGRWAGLHASCLWIIRENDVAVLGWDMMDQYPNEYGI
ncbi:MAG: cyclase family protein [SAR202 cluster bacterium]|nr:cyclase family protein [SAR202 cluster bacterium]